MNSLDARGVAVSGATPGALAAYERALAAFVSWRSGADAEVAQALQEAPGFVMAHLLRAYLLVGSRDPRRVRAAAPLLRAAAALPASAHERLHLAAIGRVLDDDYEGATALLGSALQAQPRDLLALSMASTFDYLLGDAARLRARTLSVLPAWPGDLAGYHGVQSLLAFALVESGAYAQAEDAALAALALDEHDARAHHAMAHVFEMTERFDAGVRWMNATAPRWGRGTVVATHCWWHLALFHLARDDGGAALALYDRRIRADGSRDLADLIDASALLWRLRLRGVDGGARWPELAAAWEPRLDDRYCSFSDVHAMLAFVGAGDARRAHRLEQALQWSARQPTRHGRSTRQLGLPAAQGLMAFGADDHARAIGLFATLPAGVHALGGSHAQRDVLHLTLMRSVEAMRRPARRAQHTKHERPPLDMRPTPSLPRLVAP